MTAITGVFIATFPVWSRSGSFSIRTLTSYLSRIIRVIAGERLARLSQGTRAQRIAANITILLINCWPYYRVSKGNIASTSLWSWPQLIRRSVQHGIHTYPAHRCWCGRRSDQQAPWAFQSEYHAANLCPPFPPEGRQGGQSDQRCARKPRR